MKSLREYITEVNDPKRVMLVVGGEEFQWKEIGHRREIRKPTPFVVYDCNNGLRSNYKSYGDAAATAVFYNIDSKADENRIEERFLKPNGKTMQDFLDAYNIQLTDKAANFNRFVPMNFEAPDFLECAWVCDFVSDYPSEERGKQRAAEKLSVYIDNAEDVVNDLYDNRRKYGVK